MPAVISKRQAFEKGDKLYIVAPLVPYRPTEQEIEEYAFAKDIVGALRSQAPNDNLAWFGGHYVSGDKANLNGAMWLTQDLAIASLTPLMMPVTVMHDPRTAVGVIAHAKLDMPDGGVGSKIETALALWRHRFPEAVEEAEHNHAQGTLMQSMECLAPRYECSVCRMPFLKEPDGAERANWCDHLKASQPNAGFKASASTENANASRILRGVTFTGTGLIFGTRGATGADPEANLESFQEEVAEFHARAHRDTSPKKTQPKRSKRMAEIDDREYAELLAARTERDSLKAQVAKIPEIEAVAAKVPDLESKVTTLEAEKVAAETAKVAAEKKVTDFEEKANQETLRTQRWELLGSEFTGKLDSMPTTKASLLEAAAAYSDDAWDARLKEVEEATAIKRDAKKDGDDDKGGNANEKANKDNPIFSKEETARFAGGGGGAAPARSNIQTPDQRRSVVAGLAKPPKKS